MARTNTRRMHQLRTAFFEEGRRLADGGDPEANCWLCKGEIDYDAAPGSTPDSHHLDHFHPVSTHPELQEDPDNFRHSHVACNLNRGSSTPSAGLGEEMPAWW